MSRFIVCDVCEKRFSMDLEDEVLLIQIPSHLITETADREDRFEADVCGWVCLRRIADKFSPIEEEDEEPAAQPARITKKELDEGPKNSLPGVRIKSAGWGSGD